MEELDIMINIQKKQKELLKRFKRHAENMLDRDMRIKARNSDIHIAPKKIIAPKMPLLSAPDEEKKAYDEAMVQHKLDQHEQDAYEKFRWFRTNMDEQLEEADDHVEELEGLRTSADSVLKSVSAIFHK